MHALRLHAYRSSILIADETQRRQLGALRPISNGRKPPTTPTSETKHNSIFWPGFSCRSRSIETPQECIFGCGWQAPPAPLWSHCRHPPIFHLHPSPEKRDHPRPFFSSFLFLRCRAFDSDPKPALCMGRHRKSVQFRYSIDSISFNRVWIDRLCRLSSATRARLLLVV